MASRQIILKKISCLIGCILLSLQAFAAAPNACSTASIVNPNLDGGMGGTGAIANGGVGGTGVTAESGLGGTGVTADGGMGGTGIFAENGLLPDNSKGGIAIIGVVTGFASICVNDTEVHYDANTPIFDNGNSAKLANLTAGQMVMMTADRVSDRLVARAIGMIDAVVGPIDKLDLNLMQIEVMGQTIQLDVLAMQQMHTLEQGAVVRVSGHRLANGRIVATRVSITNKKGLASTYGIVTSVASDGFAVSGTKITINNKSVLDKIKVGHEMLVGGAWNGSAIQPIKMVAQPVKNAMNRAETAIVEGFVGLEGVNGISLAGADVLIPQVRASYSSIANSTGKVVKMEMHRDAAGKWVCDKVEERQGALFDKYNLSNNHSNRGRGSSGQGRDNERGSSAVSSSGDSSGSGAGSASDTGADSSSGGLGLPDDNGSGFGAPPARINNSGKGPSGSGPSSSGSAPAIVVPKPATSSGSGSGSSGSSSSGSGSSGSGKGSGK